MKYCLGSFLSELLPYELEVKKNGGIRTALKDYQTLLYASLAAIRAMQKKDFEQFDALVGENACQIRALWMCLVACNHLIDIDNLVVRVLNVLNKIERLFLPSVLEPLMMSHKHSFKTVMEQEELHLFLNHRELFLLQCYLLYVMKTEESDQKQNLSLYCVETADPKKFKEFGEVTTSFSRNLLSRLRQRVAMQSVQFVRELAEQLKDTSLRARLSEKTHNALSCIPMFWAYKTILQAACQAKIPLVIHVKFLGEGSENYNLLGETKLFYAVDSKGHYEERQPTVHELEKAAFVVQGVVVVEKQDLSILQIDWKAAIKKHDILDVILAGAADHRQYPDPTLDTIIEALKDAEYLRYKEFAKKEGFAAKNPSTFFIQHVYASLTSRILQKQEAQEVFSAVDEKQEIGALG